MELSYAIEYLTTLADGVDPATGEVLPAGHICNRADTVRALYAVLRPAEKRASENPPNAGKPWSPQEDDQLLAEYHAGQTVPQLAQLHARTTGAIRSRLVHLGEIENRRDAR